MTQQYIFAADLPVASSVDDADTAVIVQGGVVKQAEATKVQRGSTFGKSLAAASDDAAGRQILSTPSVKESIAYSLIFGS